MVNQIAMFSFFSLSVLTHAMDSLHFQEGKDMNKALICATASTVNGYFDQEVFNYVECLLKNGADPNFVSPIFGVTPLMRAVRANSPEVVKLLLKKGAKVNVSNPDSTFVRDFNLIYSRKKIVPIIASITDFMLKIETHNAMNPCNKINCLEKICSMRESQIIRNAAMIDKMLENHRAYSDILADKHPLLNILRDARVRRALLYVFAYHMKHLPDALRYMLCNKGVPRAASVPGLFFDLSVLA